MFRTIIVALAALTLAQAALAAVRPDPRTADNAFIAVRHYLSARYHLPSSTSWGSGTHTCTPTDMKRSVWRCSWSDGVAFNGAPATGAASVTFRAFGNGWHTRVRFPG